MYKSVIKRRNWAKEYRKANKNRIKMNHLAYRIRRRRFIDAMKNKPCLDCGDWFRPVQMDFDHRPNESKSFEIAQIGIVKLEALYNEIKKCDLVCANCHRLRTYKRNQHNATKLIQTLRAKDRGESYEINYRDCLNWATNRHSLPFSPEPDGQ